MNHGEMLELLDYKRQVAELYAAVRSAAEPKEAWDEWRAKRDRLFAEHPQSALVESERNTAGRLTYFPYDPAFRVPGELKPAPVATYEIPSSDGSTMTFTRVAIAHFSLSGAGQELECFWLEGYGGGLFLPFRDATSGTDTYGGGRYLLDTVKGADLGTSPGSGRDDSLLLDFNFSYNPSCSYNPKWACPLSPPGNKLDIEVRAGEKHRG